MAKEEEDESVSFIGKNKKLIAGAGVSISAFTSIVFAYIDTKTEAISDKVTAYAAYNREYIDHRNNAIEKRLESIENVLTRIDDRIYNLTKKGE